MSISVADRRARLATRHRLSPAARADSVEDAAASMVALHATDPASVYLSSWARVDGLIRADVERALYADRTVVKQLAMRRTLFIFPRETLAAAVNGAGRRVADTEARQLVRDVERGGLHPDGAGWLQAATQAVIDRLAAGCELTWPGLRGAVPLLRGTIRYGEGKRWGGDMPVGPRVLSTLSARGEIVRGHNTAGWMSSAPRWASMSCWLGGALEATDPREGRAELVRRWLRSFGPGTEADVKWWLGETVRDVREAVRTIGAIDVDLGSATGYVLADDVDPVEPVEPWAALLPALDPTTMGWRDRGWYLGAHRAQLFDSTGNAGTTAWWDGRIVGAWHQLHDANVEVHLLEDVGREGAQALQLEAERLTGWLDGARPGARWPSPVIADLQRNER